MSFWSKLFGCNDCEKDKSYAGDEKDMQEIYEDMEKEERIQHWNDPTKAVLVYKQDEPITFRCKHGTIACKTFDETITTPINLDYFSYILCEKCRLERNYSLGPEIKCPNHKLLEKC